MEILGSRILLRSADPVALQRFYRERLGLAVAREYPGGIVFHAGNGFIEVPAHLSPDGNGETPGGEGAEHARSADRSAALWLQVRDVHAAAGELRAAGVDVAREPRTEPWGLIEMHIHDPDGRLLILVEIPDTHPLRRDTR